MYNKIPAAKYLQVDQRTHIYENGDTEVGGTDNYERFEFLYESGKINYRKINEPPACQQIFLEILSNATDAIERTRLDNEHVQDIPLIIDITKNSVKITNFGKPITIERHPTIENNPWIPYLIFGELRTSTNYNKNEEKSWSGKNGYGAKLTNIFSTEFIIDLCDGNYRYTQRWYNNMLNYDEPIIKKCKKKPYSTVYYEMDFERFNMKEFSNSMMALMKFHVISSSLTNNIKIGIENTDIVLDYRTMDKFAILLEDTEYQEFEYGKSKYCLINSKVFDNKSYLSFVNGQISKDGGVHVERAYDAVLTYMKSKYPNYTHNKRYLKSNIFMIVLARVINPKFASQSKSKLLQPNRIVKIDTKLSFEGWRYIEYVIALKKSEMSELLSQSNGKKTRNVNVDKLSDANFAATKQSDMCTLFIVEGDSAANYALTMIENMEGARDYNGVYAIRGKPLNVNEVSIERLSKNKEIIGIKSALGLVEERDYTEGNNFSTLRYGRLVILADADVDGKHIVGLMLNYFNVRFDTLFKQDFLYYMRTPILRVIKGRQCIAFLNDAEYEDWVSTGVNPKQWTHKYYKGLASSVKENIKDDVSRIDELMIRFVDDEKGKYHLRLAFSKDLSDQRKMWIGDKDIPDLDSGNTISITNFIRAELIQYAHANLERSIPGIDGLKTSQRKVLWASMKYWKSHSRDCKTSELASYIAQNTNYHHGVASLYSAINLMTTDFVGSNNMNYFVPKATFGDRRMLGANAGAPRYTFVAPQKWWKLMFRQEDEAITNYVFEEGKHWEPYLLYPLLPLSLLNGARGIATGYSTFIPNHHPLELIRYIKDILINNEPKQLVPWYKGFKGDIEILNREASRADLNTILKNEDNENQDYYYTSTNTVMLNTMKTSGKLEYVSGNTYQITEIPIGIPTDAYEKYLKQFEREKMLKLRINGTSENINYEIKVMNDFIPSLKNLGLHRSFGISNLVYLFDQKPVIYHTADKLLVKWIKWRYGIYEKRYKYYSEEYYPNELKSRRLKLDIIKAILRGFIDENDKDALLVVRKSDAEIREQLSRFPNTTLDMIKQIKLSRVTQAGIDKMKTDIENIENEFNEYLKLTPIKIWNNELDELSSYIIKNKLV